MSTEQSTAYPAGAPVVNGRLLTLDSWLNSPDILQATVEAVLPPLLSDLVFRDDSTNSPAVLYNEAGVSDLYPAVGDVEFVTPEAELPLIDFGDSTQRVAVSRKSGFAAEIEDDAREDNALDAMRQKQQLGVNAMQRQDSARCLQEFYTKVPIVSSVGTWDTGRNWQKDLLPAQGEMESYDVPYFADTVVVHPLVFTALQLNTDYQNSAPREDPNLNPMLQNTLLGLGGFRWAKNRSMPIGDALLLSPKTVGVNMTRRALRVEAERDASKGKTTVVATKRSMPIIDQPYAARVIRGILSV